MSRMSELHDDLTSIHQILLGQRKVAQDQVDSYDTGGESEASIRVSCINDLLLEFEAAGVVWPDNVVSLDTVTAPNVTHLDNTWVKRPTNDPEVGA